MDSEQLQRRLFDDLAARYQAHYDDPTSAEYRRRFIHEPLLGGIDFAGARVLDAMCGSGQTTPFLLARGADVTGLDISESALASFRARWPDCDAVCASLLDSGLASASFDCVVVEAGLHHLHPHVDRGVEEVHRLLRPGGRFCFAEPHRGSLFDGLRRAWYARDALFAANEESIDLEVLEARHGQRFAFERSAYLGNVAYLLVLQSMVLRLPLRLKRYYAPLLFPLEALVTRFQGRRLSFMVACQWRKRDT